VRAGAGHTDVLMGALEQIAALVHRESGIALRESQIESLAAIVKRLDPASDPERFISLMADPVDGRPYIGRLLDEVTVQETFFLREAQQLDRIPWQALFDTSRQRSADVRIWSAGCATGEEAYTLALLAWEAAGRAEPPVRILATDISEGALARARQGEYRPRSTRDLNPTLRRRYFRGAGEQLVVDERLRSLVTFARHNLVRDPAPPAGEAPFDLIFCRNVLIYFDRATADRVTAALDDALAPSGTLILGAADALYRGAERLRALPSAAARPTPAATETGVIRPTASRITAPPPARDPASTADAARASRSADALSHTGRLLAADPLNATAHFLDGLAKLESGAAAEAVDALRRALYAEPDFGPAALQLGRAYESLGNRAAARRAYGQALRTCDRDGDLHAELLDQVDVADLIAAATARLDALTAIDRDGQSELEAPPRA
jgi:chemotaxis protein methyltransferase CheR